MMNSLVEPLHIAFGVDRNYVPAMGVTMISIVANNPQLNVVFHVLSENLPPEDVEIIERLTSQLNAPIHIHNLTPKILSGITDKKSPNLAIYYRLFLSDLLNNIATRILYIDADIVCLRELPPLPNLDNAIAAVVLDTDQADRNAALGRPTNTPYFNSGVMYINIKRWNEADITRKALDILASNPKFRFPDQDALNILLANDTVLFDSKWNRMWEVFQTTPNIYSDTIFLHYAGDKPWHEWRKAFLDPPFAKYFQLSPWPATRLLTPSTRKNKLQYAKHLLKQGNLFKGIRWYIRYLSTPKRSS